MLSHSAARSDLRSPRIALGSVSGSRTAIHSVATTSPVVPLIASINCSIATPQLLTAVSQFRVSTTSQVAVNMCIVPPTLARFGKLAMVDWTSWNTASASTLPDWNTLSDSDSTTSTGVIPRFMYDCTVGSVPLWCTASRIR
eukprot:scaffold21671_cov68-Attheya_sp.AAC.1